MMGAETARFQQPEQRWAETNNASARASFSDSTGAMVRLGLGSERRP
jgi:hypothetical protein